MVAGHIINKMDKELKTLKLLDKKKERMGLTDEEQKKFNETLVEYILNKALMYDRVFEKHVMALVTSEEGRKLRLKVNKSLDWDGSIVLKLEDVIAIREKFNSIEDKDSVIESINELYYLLCDDLKDGAENEFEFEEVSMLLSEGVNDNVETLYEYLDFKFDSIFSILYMEDGEYEEIKEEKQ